MYEEVDKMPRPVVEEVNKDEEEYNNQKMDFLRAEALLLEKEKEEAKEIYDAKLLDEQTKWGTSVEYPVLKEDTLFCFGNVDDMEFADEKKKADEEKEEKVEIMDAEKLAKNLKLEKMDEKEEEKEEEEGEEEGEEEVEMIINESNEKIITKKESIEKVKETKVATGERKKQKKELSKGEKSKKEEKSKSQKTKLESKRKQKSQSNRK